MTRTYLAKEASPEQLSWRARIAASEQPLRQSFLAWVAEIQAAVTDTAIAHAILTRGSQAFDHIIHAIEFQPVLGVVAGAEATREFDRLTTDLKTAVRLSFNLHDPNFDQAVRDHQARLVREVTQETRRAIANMIERGYRNGMHPYDVAPTIREAVGLTSRQGQAVLNYADALTKKGAAPSTVADRSLGYARRMRTRRAQTIARTETARAAVMGRLQSYDQAAAADLFDPQTAELEWSSVQDDPNEICATLDGERVPYGEDFAEGYPPVHPMCRCSVFLVL